MHIKSYYTTQAYKNQVFQQIIKYGVERALLVLEKCNDTTFQTSMVTPAPSSMWDTCMLYVLAQSD